MAWNNITFSYGSILTSTQMTQLQANFSAMATQNSGSPKIWTPSVYLPCSFSTLSATFVGVFSGYMFVTSDSRPCSIAANLKITDPGYICYCQFKLGSTTIFDINITGTTALTWVVGSGTMVGSGWNDFNIAIRTTNTSEAASITGFYITY